MSSDVHDPRALRNGLHGLILLLALLCGGAALPAPGLPPVRILRPAELRADLERLRFTIDRAHGDPYRFTSKGDVDAAFARLSEEIASPRSDLDFFRGVAAVVDLIHDQHTDIQPPASLQRFFSSNSRRVVPLDIHFVGERAFVLADVSDSPTVAAGSEVVAIDGRSMAEIIDVAGRLIPVDGPRLALKAAGFNRSFWFHYGLAYGPADSYKVTLRDPGNGRLSSVTLAGIPPKRLFDRVSRTKAGPPRRLEFPGPATAILTLDHLSGPETGPFLDDAFRQIEERGISDLIIDLRSCRGGEDKYNNRLLSYLSRRPFRFYTSRKFRVRSYDDLKYVDYTIDDFMSDEQRAKLPAAARANPFASLTLPKLLRFTLDHDEAEGVISPASRNHFDGDIYLLTSGRSASSAAEIAGIMHHLGLGTIIGEQANGDYQGLVAEVMPVLTLPNSGIKVRIPLVRNYNDVMPILHGQSAPPSFAISQSVADVAGGRDTVMEFARALIERRRVRQ